MSRRVLDELPVWNARVASLILNRLGENTRVTDATIFSTKYAIGVLATCSATEFLWFFCATVLAFPSPPSRKAIGVLLGVTILLLVNQARIVSLFYIGAHFPRFFDAAHEDLWGIVLIVTEVILCAVWIGWSRKNDRLESHVVA